MARSLKTEYLIDVKIFLSVALILLHVCAFAQHTKVESEGHTNSAYGMKGSHRLTMGLCHTHVSRGKIDGDTKWLALASWSFNYDYLLSKKFAIGLQSDLILETFIIENSSNEFIERKYPFTLVPVAVYKTGKHFSLLGGGYGIFRRT